MGLIFQDESYKIIGACFNVYNKMGSGFLEAVYQECLSIEFDEQNIPYKQQFPLTISYGDKILTQKYITDFLAYESIIIEIKSVKTLTDEHRSQLLNYLAASGKPLGLLVNFGARGKLEHERLANTK